MELIDTHCHLDFPDYAADLAQVKERAHKADVNFFISVGTDLASSQKEIELAQANDTFAAVGIHPHEADKVKADEAIEQLRRLAVFGKVVAIGETGLDYFKHRSQIANQKLLFSAQIKLALELKRPLILHIRDAYSDALEILKREYLPFCNLEIPGVAHSFSAGIDYAEKFIDLGFMIGISGILTFPDATALQAAVKKMPLEKIVLETDAPFLAPQTFRGKRNEPAYVMEVAKRIAELKDFSLAEVAEATTRNARKLFRI